MTNAIAPIGAGFEPIEMPSFEGPKQGGESFGAMLERSIGDVNQLLTQADEKNVEMALGKTENLHETMISVEKAETALRMMTQFRNKALEAYNEVLRMQL